VSTLASRPGDVSRPSGPFNGPIETITESDEEIRAYLEGAEIPPLLPSLAYLTGDTSFLRDDLRPVPGLFGLPQGGLTAEQQRTARALAHEILVRYRDDGCRPAPPPSDEDLLRIVEFAVGDSGMSDYLPLLKEELAFGGTDQRAPDWQAETIAPGRGLRVAIIGAGMSGLLAAHRLRQAGVPFVVLEKNDDVGGTWLENSYPGCRVDNPNHTYSYAFAQRRDWPLHYSTQGVLLDYFQRCADAFGVREHIRFGVEVRDAVWSDTDLCWTLRLRAPDGTDGTEELRADVVISATGQLNRPSLPPIADRESFAGPAFHSAHWDHSVCLAGKRVAVIGTGASAVQLIPELAAQAGELLVFQRTAAWIGSTPDYHDAVAPGLAWLFGHVPAYAEFNRFCIFWKLGDGTLSRFTVDETWDKRADSVSAANDVVRQNLTGYLRAQFADRPDLLEHLIPNYPVGAKRVIRDDGSWSRAVKQDNVRLVSTGIDRITPTGIVTVDGTQHDVDVIVYATGFQASNFLTPMRVTGRGGIDLHEHWGGDARAYLGITIPQFPNLFCLYGPNTNLTANGSIVYVSELGVRYILGCLELLLRSGHGALSIRKDVHDRFNERVDAGNQARAWGQSGVHSWYKNEYGRVSQNWPFTLLEYWQRTLRPDPDDFELVK